MIWYAFLLVILILIGRRAFNRGEALPKDIPWAGGQKYSIFRRTRLYLRSVFESHVMLQEGYEEYSRKGRPFIFANWFTGAEVQLPMDYMDWVHDQPENVLSSFEAHREFMRADWTFLHPTIFHEHVFESVIKLHLTRHLDNLTAVLADEASRAIEQLALNNKSFELGDHASWKRLVLQTVSRIYVGEPLCRDASYLEDAATFNSLSMLVAAIIGILPEMLRPLLAPVICLRDYWYHSRCASKTKPLISERLKSLQQGCTKLPNDLITWAVRDALQAQEVAPFKMDVKFLASRISMMNFVSIDSTSITVENVLHDILANPQQQLTNFHGPVSYNTSLLDHLRAEAYAACENSKGKEQYWKSIVNSLPLLEACLKESLRLNNFISRTNVRKVMVDDGLDIPGIGRIPKGVNVGFPLWAAHHDEQSYGDAGSFMVNRWLDGSKKQTVSVFGTQKLDHGHYLPFGYRRHACPGRFFALRVVKLIILHLVLNFDLELLDRKRGINYWLGVSRGPPMGGIIRFTKRQSNNNVMSVQ